MAKRKDGAGALGANTGARSTLGDLAGVDPGRLADAASSPDAVVQEILEGLHQGRYVPGQRLVQSELSQRANVSRNSVREALKGMASEGVVRLTLHHSAYVRMLSRREVRNVLLLNEVIMGLAARLAAENIVLAGDRTELAEKCARLMQAKGPHKFAEFIRARVAYYATLIRIGDNEEITPVLPGMHLVRIQFRGYPTSEKEEEVRYRYYQQLTDAILARKPAEAERIAREQIRRFLRNLDDLPDAAFSRDEGRAAIREVRRAS